MKTIGLLGGMSWESTILYYQLLNRGVRERLGGLHSAKIVMHSVDFCHIEKMQVAGEWQQAGDYLGSLAHGLERAGADMILICTNLMHKVAPIVAKKISVPLLHIADAAGRAIAAQGLTKIGLLGAGYTMEEDFYRQRLQDHFALDVVVPNEAERRFIHDTIFSELCQGKILDRTRSRYLEIIENLHREGAQGVILGCTEIPLLVRPEDTALPLFNTAGLHAEYALEVALADAEPVPQQVAIS